MFQEFSLKIQEIEKKAFDQNKSETDDLKRQLNDYKAVNLIT